MSREQHMAKIDAEMNTKFTNDKHRMVSNVVYTGHWIKTQFDAYISPFGLSSPQYNILRILRGANGWLRMQEVRDRMVEKSPNATRLCDKLEQKALLIRQRNDEDRRIVSLQISEEGLRLLAQIDEKVKGKEMQFFDNITAEEAKIVNEILDKMRG